MKTDMKSLMSARILIVEDEQITAEDLRDIVTELGYDVVDVVANGSDAIARAETEHPDLALMDIRIKGNMDGTQTARVLRERFNVPVIYLTAHADRETLERAKHAEPLGYVCKPFQQGELHASIEMALHKHRVDLRAKGREQILSSTLGALGEGVLSVDSEGTITLLNSAAESWTGTSAADGMGRPIDEIFKLVDANGAPAATPVREVMETGEVRELVQGLALVNRIGGKKAVGGSVAPVRDHRGEISGAVLVFGERAGLPGEAHGAGQTHEQDGLNLGDFKMVAVSPLMKQVVRFAHRVAESEASTILIEGESGTGKDVIAHFMHDFGRRRDRPFVPLNCAAIPETLLESELFGYEKGAFTDARAPKPGILEIASGGSVFLDEIGEMPILVQAKMLRVLEEQSFRRLGGVRDIKVDLRVMAASNRNLSDAVEQGRFRLDLYYRLNVIQVSLPPLRQRKEDILPLARYFIQHYNQRFKRDLKGLTTASSSAMLDYDWPGNIRELRNTIERAVLLEEGDWIQPATLRLERGFVEYPAADVKPALEEKDKAGGTLEETERRMLMDALDKTGWNQTRAAMLLGISRDTLRYKIKKYNLPRRTGTAE